jgi:hypothetical protein
MALLGLASQAQDLFAEFARTGWASMFWFLLVLILLWAMPTHYAARLLIDTDRRFRISLAPVPNRNEYCSQFCGVWIPRVLGLLTFLAVLIAIWRSHINLPNLHDISTTAAVNRALIEMALLVVVGAIVFVYYVIWRPHDADLPILRLLKPVNRAIAPFWRALSPGFKNAQDSDDEVSQDVGKFLLLGLFVLFVLIFILGAENVARIFPRALAVPFVLGGWLPFLSYLSAVGRQVRAPFILIWFGAIAVAAVIFGDNHSVRTVNATTQAGYPVDVTPLQLEDEVTLWKKANACEDKSPCPRPIIITAAGGASRAGFYMATVFGFLLQSPEATAHGLDTDKVRNQLLAISGVSGGSVGAVMVTAALAQGAGGSHHPCTDASPPLLWKNRVSDWRDCVEALTSGDFLTADFLGFAFNDMLPFAFFRDRAAVLEDTWRQHYDRMIAGKNHNGAATVCKGLECPFLSLRPTSNYWIPLLLLNGTSEATGGRIITTLLSFTYAPKGSCPGNDEDGKCQIFAQADRFHDLLSVDVPGPAS